MISAFRGVLCGGCVRLSFIGGSFEACFESSCDLEKGGWGVRLIRSVEELRVGSFVSRMYVDQVGTVEVRF